MKLKYYLNGFGIGVLFATVILSVAFLIRSSNNEMTDEEVIARARILGMVTAEEKAESQTTSSKEPETTSEEAVTEKESTTIEPETTAELETTTEESETTVEPETTTTEPETTSEPETTTEAETTTEPPTTTSEPATTAQQTGEPERIAFEIVSGMTSESVAELLKDKGIISDAKAFNAYVVEKGYAGRIRTGKYEIISSASYDEIIDFICR